MHTVFSFLVLHSAYLGTACREFGRLREGDYLCGSCSGWTDSGDFFLSQRPLQEVWRLIRLFQEALSISSHDDSILLVHI